MVVPPRGYSGRYLRISGQVKACLLSYREQECRKAEQLDSKLGPSYFLICLSGNERSLDKERQRSCVPWAVAVLARRTKRTQLAAMVYKAATFAIHEGPFVYP